MTAAPANLLLTSGPNTRPNNNKLINYSGGWPANTALLKIREALLKKREALLKIRGALVKIRGAV